MAALVGNWRRFHTRWPGDAVGSEARVENTFMSAWIGRRLEAVGKGLGTGSGLELLGGIRRRGARRRYDNMFPITASPESLRTHSKLTIFHGGTLTVVLTGTKRPAFSPTRFPSIPVRRLGSSVSECHSSQRIVDCCYSREGVSAKTPSAVYEINRVDAAKGIWSGPTRFRVGQPQVIGNQQVLVRQCELVDPLGVADWFRFV